MAPLWLLALDSRLSTPSDILATSKKNAVKASRFAANEAGNGVYHFSAMDK